jgi:dienelactone hydrolase
LKLRKIQYLGLLFILSLPVNIVFSTPALEGFVLTGNPESTNGATWTFRDTINGIIYDLSGSLMKPTGAGLFPAVIISHGKGGNAANMMNNIGKKMRPWGLVCISTNYTHAGNAPIGSPGDTTMQGASDANVLRGAKCFDILASLGYVDTNRVAAHGHSMGAFLTGALTGTRPWMFKVASHTAGGVSDLGPYATKSWQANGIIIPYQMHHGDIDSVVVLSLDMKLDTILQNNNVPHFLHIYVGANHNISADSVILSRVQQWYTQWGLFTPTGIVKIENELPINFKLYQNYPNPFNPISNIEFTISDFEFVKLTVYDIRGKEIETLVNDNLAQGHYKVQWDASRYSSGVYYYTLQANNFTETKKLLLLK